MDDYAEQKMMAGVDTVSELLELLAVLGRNYFEFLLKAGFEEDNAIEIIKAYQDTVLSMMVGKHLTRKER